MNRISNLKLWILSVLISLLIELPFVWLLMHGPHSTYGGIGTLFFAPAISFVLLVLSSVPDRAWFAPMLVCQTVILSVLFAWILSWRRRALWITLLSVCSFLVFVVFATSLLGDHERHVWQREEAIKGAADNAVVDSLRYFNKSLAAYKSKYGEYPAQIDDLNLPSEGPVDSRHAGLLKLPLPMEEFFAFTYSARKDSSGTRSGYEIYVDPKAGKWSNLYHYFTDESGSIRFETTHAAAKHGLVVNQQLHPSVTVQ